jgi:hypothetical protein
MLGYKKKLRREKEVRKSKRREKKMRYRREIE